MGEEQEGAGQEERDTCTGDLLRPGWLQVWDAKAQRGREGAHHGRGGWIWSSSPAWEGPKPGSPTHTLWGGLSCITCHILREK